MARAEKRNMETEGDGAATENAAGSQAVARVRQQQQQQTRLLQPQAGASEPSGETKAAAAEDTVTAVTEAAARAAMQRPPVGESEKPPVGEGETTEVVGLRAEVAQLKAKLAAEKRKFQQLEADAEAAGMELIVELAAENSRRMAAGAAEI